MFIQVRHMSMNVGWVVRATTPFGNTPKTTASRLSRKTRTFRNAAYFRGFHPNSFGSVQPTVRVPKSRISCGRLSQSSHGLSNRTRNRAWPLASAARVHRLRPLPARFLNESYYRARYYDPGAGRFLSEDPVSFYGGMNFYRYTTNNPANSKDPSGWVDVIPLPDANIHSLSDIDADCGHSTAGGCERVGYTADWSCKKDCDKWSAKVKITLGGAIYVATGPFPYKGRNPADPSIHDTASALAHERLHVNDKLNAILPIYEGFESKKFDSKEDCEKAGLAADLQASPAWNTAGQASQRRRH